MRVLWLICVVFFQPLVDVKCDEDNEFATIWAPNNVHERRPYNVIVLPTNVGPRTEMSLQFRNSYGTISLATDKLQKISIKNDKSIGSKKELNLTMTLYREIRNKQPQCMTKVLQSLKVVKQQFYSFIQLDKPIYKPGDKVQFRIIIIDQDMKPFHYNNILVQFFDPFNRTIQEFSDPEEMFVGIFNSSFTLNPVTPLGEWTARVIIDKKPQYAKSKKFQVQKYTLPPFQTYINIKSSHLVVNSVLRLKIFAKYSFGDYVRGSFDLIVAGVGNNTEVYHSKTYTNISGVFDLSLKVKEELKIKTNSKIKLNITAIFTEPESGISAVKSIPFNVYAKQELQFDYVHPEKFMPGIPFGIKVFITKWNDEKILKSVEKVNINFALMFENETTVNYQADVQIENSVAIHNFVVPDKIATMKLEIGYLKKRYEKDIEVGSIEVGINKMLVEHGAKNPKYKDNVKIYVRATYEMDQLIVLVMSRFGNIESHSVKCDYQILCDFDIKISRQMMPESKIVVYSVISEKSMLHGETVIKTDQIGANTLDIDLPRITNTRTAINMQFTTRPNSQVYLLAFDKKLTNLAKGNEVLRSDVITEVADYDGNNKVTVFDMQEWHDCTPDEIKRVKKGRALITVHGGETFTVNGEDEDEFDTDEDDVPPAITDPDDDDSESRDNFPETWIYDDFPVTSNVTNMTFTTPDSITSWMIYGFSVNNESGLAIANPKELTVKNQFFIELFIPYSVRYNETLRLDVLIYNYAKSEKELNVKVVLHNIKGVQFEILEYSGCNPTGRKNVIKDTKTINVPHETVKRVSFYILPNLKTVSAQKNFFKYTNIRVDATATAPGEDTLKDSVKRRLLVEPIGVKIYDISNKNHQLKIGSPKNDTQKIVLTDNVSEYPRMKLAISGDFLSDSINMDTKFEIYPYNCLEQRTSKIKGNVEFLRYLKTKNPNPPTKGFAQYYQNLLMERTQKWNYRNTAGFRAYFIEAIATAMEINALPMNRQIIERELDALKSFQDSQGKFTNFGSVPESPADADTASYFHTAYVLIPFIRFNKNLTKNYNDVISKGIGYLKGSTNKLKLKRQALSIAAYTFALYNDTVEAKNLLKAVESDFVKKNKEVCYKIERSSAGCDLRHTSYAAIAYITLNDFDKARSVIAWLLQTHNMNKYYSNTHPYAIATEAIAKYVSTLPTKNTEFTVNVRNDGGFNVNIPVNKKNLNNAIELDLPDYSLVLNTSITGSGYCSITTILEKTVSVDVADPLFTLKLTQKNAAIKDEKIIQVCAIYSPGESQSFQTLLNVIYDVKIPSGYIYSSIVDYEKKPEIKLVDTRESKTRIQIYYNDFEKGKNYCVDVKTKKLFDVKNIKNAGVMVYDYENKNNIAIGFYTFADICVN